jgi:hypothetical protein
MKFGMSCAMVVFLAMLTGCSSFDGQWLEDGVVGADGKVGSAAGGRRLALDFEAPSLIRYGLYEGKTKVVDDTSVQDDWYFLFDGWQAAQFGEMTARLEDGHLVTIVNGEKRQFSRVTGVGIFPPRVKPPPIS